MRYIGYKTHNRIVLSVPFIRVYCIVNLGYKRYLGTKRLSVLYPMSLIIEEICIDFHYGNNRNLMGKAVIRVADNDYCLLQVIERALFHANNCYRIPNVKVTGRLCRTNLPSNTAFRGFGGPQGMFICEAYIDDIATKLKLPVDRVSFNTHIASVGSENRVSVNFFCVFSCFGSQFP